MSCSSSCLQPSISGKGVSPSAMPKKISQQHVGSLETEDLVEEILFSTAKWRVLIIACDAYAPQPLSKCKEAAEVIRKEIERCWPNTTEIGLVLDPGPDALRDACEEFVRRPTVNQRFVPVFCWTWFRKRWPKLHGSCFAGTISLPATLAMEVGEGLYSICCNGLLPGSRSFLSR